MWLTRFSIDRPIIVSMLFIALAVFGFISYNALGASLQPNVAFPVVVVVANYPGASPAEMEKLVIKPIEDQIDGIDNLDRLSATSQEGIASVLVQFKLDTNLDFAAIDVQRRVDTARVYMPVDLDPPLVVKNGADDPMLTLALSSKSMSREALADLVHDRIVPDIKHIPNIASVDVRGDVAREIQVLPEPSRLMGSGATLADIFSALQNNNANLPGGRIDSPTVETSVSVHADIVNPEDILGIPLPVPTGSQRVLRIGDVAHVVDGHREERVISHFNGAPTLLLDVNRLIAADEIKATRTAREQLKTIEAQYPRVHFAEIEATADYTAASLDGVLQSLLEGVALTAIVLLLFLHAWRNALVVMVAIPSSLLSTFIVMRLLHFRLDNISLMGLSLIIGILVDDSIVVLENITRHRDLGEAPREAALRGRAEIGGAAVAITLVDVVVFLPIAFLSGFVGKYMEEFGIVVVVATLFSLFVSFTLTPMLAARWSVRARSEGIPRWAAWFQSSYEWLLVVYRHHVLELALRHRVITVGICIALIVGSIALVPLGLVQSEFVPAAQTGDISMTVTYPVGTPIGTTEAGIARLAAGVQSVPGIESVISTVGYKPAGWGRTTGGNVAVLHGVMAKNRRRDTNRAVADVRRLGYLVPGADFNASTSGGGGSGAPIYYTLSGPDAVLPEAAKKLAALIREQPGTVNVQTGAESEAPRVDVQIDPSRCAVLGVSPGAAATAARIAVGGAVATRVRTQSSLVDVRLQLPVGGRSTLEDLARVRLRAMDGTDVMLGSVATFKMTKAPTKIERLDRQRVIRVTGDIDPGRGALGSVVAKVNSATAVPGFFPPGVAMKASGDSQFFAETLSSMAFALLTSFALVYMLMVILYGSFLTPFVIMFSLPVAIVGALGLLAVFRQTLNIFSLIGMLMLFGLVAKNGILLADYANTLRRQGLRAGEAIRSAAATRFRPILMTTSAMVFGMLPLALGLAEGAEFRKSMGTVLIGGLLSSLVLTLFLVPVVYVTLVGWVERRRDRRAFRSELEAPVAVGVANE